MELYTADDLQWLIGAEVASIVGPKWKYWIYRIDDTERRIDGHVSEIILTAQRNKAPMLRASFRGWQDVRDRLARQSMRIRLYELSE